MSQPHARGGRKPSPSRPRAGGNPARAGAGAGPKPGPAGRADGTPAIGAGRGGKPSGSAGTEAPASVRTAIRLMYAGAVVTAVSLIAAVETAGSFRDALHQVNPGLTPSQVQTVVNSAITLEVVASVIFLAAWVLMIWASRRGRAWARGLAGVLFGFNTLLLVLNFLPGSRAGALPLSELAWLVVSVLVWLIGLVSLVFLWRKDSSEFFRQARAV